MSEAAPLLTVLGAAPPPGGSAVFVRAADGVRLRCATWVGAGRGWAVLLQGRGEFIEKYYETVARLLALGFSVVAVDLRGQGLSQRLLADPKKGHVDTFLAYQRDVDAALGLVADRAGAGPIVLVGHSMGGAVAARALMRQAGVRAREAGGALRQPVVAAVLTSPLFGLSGGAAYQAAAPTVAGAAAAVGLARRYATGGSATHYAVATPFERNLLTTDAHRYRRLVALSSEHPDLAIGGPTWGWVRAALREVRALRPTKTPTLMALGSDEAVVSPGAIRRYAAGSDAVRLMQLPSARHEPMIETTATQERLWTAAATFFDEAL